MKRRIVFTLMLSVYITVELKVYQSSFQLNDYLKKENTPVTFISQPGNHNTDYWHSSIEHHFVYFQQHLK